jgi:hypothetical protein
MTLDPQTLELAKAALRRRETQRQAEAVEKALRKVFIPEPLKPSPPPTSDAANRKHVRIVRRGCSGFFNRSFLNY